MEGGHVYDVDDLVRRAVNMKGYFGKYGGVTVSGGEPLLQSEALISFFKQCKAAGIHTNIDTNGRVLNHHTQTLLDEYTDLVMLDVKHMDNHLHRKLTGLSNASTFAFAAHREQSGKPMWLRYVLVPGWSDDETHLRALGEHFNNYKTIEKLEIQPYHRLGVHKWKAMGWPYQLDDVPEATEPDTTKAMAILSPYFKEVKIN